MPQLRSDDPARFVCINIHRRGSPTHPLLPPTGSSRVRWHWLLRPQRMPHGSVYLSAKLIAGHGAEGERREPWPGRSGCRRCPRPESRAGDGRQPRVIQRAAPRQAAMLGNVAVEPAGTVRPAGRRRMRLPGTSVSLPGITLSDEGSQGERARTRRSNRTTR